MSSLAKFLIASSVSFLLVSPTLSAEIIKGRVFGLGEGGPDKGVSGVAVIIRNGATNAVLAESVTLADGSYELEIKNALPPKAILVFDKVGYYRRGTQQVLTNPKLAQSAIWLSREGGAGNYAKVAVENILLQKTGEAGGFDGFYAAVSALPINAKSEVFKELQLKDPLAYQSFVSADATYQAVEALTTKIKAGEEGSKYKAINAYANFGETGTVRLYGAVPTAGGKKELEAMTMKFEGVKSIRNDVMIKN